MSSALNLTREQLEKLTTPRLLNVLKVARKSKDTMNADWQIGRVDDEDLDEAIAYFKMVKEIADTREHVE